jgi:phosphoglycolate phosphatase
VPRRAAPARPPIGAVLFDLDGTLVDTAPDIADAVNAALADHRLPGVADAWVRRRIGNGTATLLREALPQGSAIGLEQLLDSFHRHYAVRCGRRGRLYPEAAVTLTSLRNAGVKLALVTNKEARFAAFVLKVHGLDDAFDFTVCGDTLAAKKPDAMVVQHCLRRLRVSAARTLLVGDSEIDVRTARNARIAVWAVSYGYNRGVPIEQARPDRVIASLAELLEPLASTIEAMAPAYSPRASSSSRYLRSSPRN